MVLNDLLDRFSKLPTGNICDANNKEGNMDPAIKPIDPSSKMAGTAFTVKCHPGDNLAIHRGILEAPAGAVLVVDVRGYCGAGHFGEIMAQACKEKGIAGLVIDGSCRDAQDIQELGFPVFCRGLNPGGTVKETVGFTNVVIECGGRIVRPDDIIVGDRDGVAIVAAEKAVQVLAAAEAIFEKEIYVKELLKQGKSTVEIYGFKKLLQDN